MTIPLLASLTITVAAAAAQGTVETVWIEPGEPISLSASIYDGAVDNDQRMFSAIYQNDQVQEATVFSYDRAAQLIWSRTFRGAMGADVSIHGIAPDHQGGVFITGVVQSGFPLGGPSLGGFNDGYLAHLDGTGAVLWWRRLGGDRDDSAFEIVRDPSGDLYVVGLTSSTAAFGGAEQGIRDAFVARYDAFGTELWVTRIGQPASRDRLFSVALDDDGGVVCAGDSTESTPAGSVVAGLIARVDGSGGIIYAARPFSDTSLSGVASDGAGGLAAVGHRTQSSMGAFVQVNASGSPAASVSLPPGGLGIHTSASGIVRLRDGSFAVAGRTNDTFGIEPNRAWVKLFSRDGTPLDEVELASSLFYLNQVDAIATNGSGTTVAFGRASDGSVTPEGPFLARLSFGGIGSLDCVGQPNSTGQHATLQALGSPLRSDESLTLFASSLPAASAAYFITSLSAGFVANPGGSQGDLCLGGAIGRFRREGEVLLSGQEGRVHLDLNLASIPQPTGTAAVSIGDTWHYQLWYRDTNPGATSNFSSSKSVLFQ